MKAALLLALTAVGITASASSVYRRIDHTPFDAYRYTITVTHTPLPKGGQRYKITVHLKEGAWPMRMTTMLTKVVVKPGSLDDYQKRGLVLTGKGNDREVTFDITKSEIALWHYELLEWAESNGRLMPGYTAYLFPLKTPPTPKI